MKINTGIGIVDKIANAEGDAKIATVGVDINPRSLYPLAGILILGTVICIVLWKRL